VVEDKRTMSNVLKSLPPHVARELRRHISPKPLISPILSGQQQPSTTSASSSSRLIDQTRNRYVLIGCTLFTMAAGCMPLILYYWIGGLNDSEKPLTAPQIRRGAFQNSGSKDVGKDPDYDFSSGTHKLRVGYGDSSEATDANSSTTSKPSQPLTAEFLAMAPNELNKGEEMIEAFAKGRGRNN
jgi:hypothetical protein